MDIGAVVKDLKALEMDMQETDKTIAGFAGNWELKVRFDYKSLFMTTTQQNVPALRFPRI